MPIQKKPLQLRSADRTCASKQMSQSFVLKNFVFFMVMKRIKKMKKKTLNRRRVIYRDATLHSILQVAQKCSDNMT